MPKIIDEYYCDDEYIIEDDDEVYYDPDENIESYYDFNLLDLLEVQE